MVKADCGNFNTKSLIPQWTFNNFFILSGPEIERLQLSVQELCNYVEKHLSFQVVCVTGERVQFDTAMYFNK